MADADIGIQETFYSSLGSSFNPTSSLKKVGGGGMRTKVFRATSLPANVLNSIKP